MIAAYDVSASALLPTTPDVAYDALVDAPLEDLLGDRTGPIPPVRMCEGQASAWGAVGQTRTVVLGDGGRILETLVVADREAGDYRYRLSDVRGPMKALVRTVDGRFSFESQGSGTRVTWSWRIHPTHPVSRMLMPAFSVFWRKAAAKAFARLGSRLPA